MKLFADNNPPVVAAAARATPAKVLHNAPSRSTTAAAPHATVAIPPKANVMVTPSTLFSLR
ncbi:MAG: hypothetical protein F4X70_05000 [Acidimicrobiia bacterium]|nr:hypothetical protein [Acidimicrobiia bacterium]